MSTEFWEAVERADTETLADLLAVREGQARDGLVALLPALASWRRQRRQREEIDRWRHRVAWRPSGVPAQAGLAGRWLLLRPPAASGEVAGWFDGCAAALAGAGAEVDALEVDAVTVTREQLAARLGEAAGGTPVAGVVSLLAVDARPRADQPAVAAGLAASLLALQALLDAGVDARLWCLTRQAAAVAPGEAPDPVQAQVWGLGRVAALELPGRWGGLVDLPAELDARSGQRLTAVLDQAGEDQVAVRPTATLARRLEPAPLGDRPAATTWTLRGTAVVTGGTSGPGARVARWLASQGQEHVVLVSRSGEDTPGLVELRRDIEQAGARVTVAACDVTDRDAVAALLDGLAGAGEIVRTVVHATLVARLAPVVEATVEHLAHGLAAKVLGAEHLDALLPDDLDAFVLFSSVAGVWGTGEHAAYAAANAHLDALAERRRARGATATSVAWGVWDLGEDAATDPEVREALLQRSSRQGVPLLDPERALSVLRESVEHGEAFVAAADVEWDRFVALFTSARPSPLLTGVPAACEALDAAGRHAEQDASAAGELAERLAGAGPAERDALLLDLVRAQTAAVLSHRSPDAVEATRAFSEIGFDSLTAVELRNRVSTATGLRLPATLVFDFPTPLALVEHLKAELLPEEAAATAPVLGQLERFEVAVTASVPTGDTRAEVVKRLHALLWKLDGAERAQDDGVDPTAIESASDEEMFALLDREFGEPETGSR